MTLQKLHLSGGMVDQDNKTTKLITALILGAILPLLDTTIISVAIGKLTDAFHLPASSISWVATGYILAATAVIPVTTWARTRFGSKRIWIFALGTFLVGSTGCGFSWNLFSLITFRVIQGMGGGMLMPILQTIVVETVGQERSRKVMGTIGVASVLAPILGPIIGSVLLQSGSWRPIFWVNPPICILAIWLGRRVIASHRGEPQLASFDVSGFLLLSPGLVSIVYALSSINSQGRVAHSLTIAASVVGIALLTLFIYRAIRTQINNPIVDLRLFKNSSFRFAVTQLFLNGFVFYGSITFLPLWFQIMRGDTVVKAAILLCIQGLGSMLSRYIIGRFTFPANILVFLGWTLTLLGTLPFAVMSMNEIPWFIETGMFIRGAGLGIVTITMMSTAYIGMEKVQIKHASAFTRIATQLGGALGLAVLSSMLTSIHGVIANSVSILSILKCFRWMCGVSALAGLVTVLLSKKPSKSKDAV